MRRGLLHALLALSLFILAIAAVSCKRQLDLVVSDARYYYVYLASVVVDGDLDFRNQMEQFWDTDAAPELDWPRTATGLVPNKYPVGVALTLAPSFLVAHALAHLGFAPPDGYSIPYQILNLAFILFLTWLAALLSDDLLVRGFGLCPRLATLAIVLYWFGSPLLYYTFREPFMAHAISWFWVTLVVWLVWRLADPSLERSLALCLLPLLGLGCGMAVVTRATNAVILFPVLIHLVLAVARTRWDRVLIGAGPVLLGGLIPILAQGITWYVLHGRWLVYSYGNEGFDWMRPVLWQTLFSSRHGLFFWSPLLLGAMAGLGWLLRSRTQQRRLLLSLVAGFLLLWYCNSAWWCWWFGDACGGRAFLELSLLFILGLAGSCELIARASRRLRLTAVGLAGVAIAWNLVLLALYVLHRIPRDEALLGF